ncbi:MAG: ribosomal RNA large subunit methyltransferase H [Gemmatimonadales bacterium]|nr:Ribosomal RNA large subunit methyltransferase H [bacterium HR33]GIW51078.1 MAG: ribosomal RNA large subunit methyltransferase H [Gemmatimonadales bacterium]
MVHVVAVGRLTDPGLAACCAEYASRIRKVLKLEIREVRPPQGRLRVTERLKLEGDRILKAVPSGARMVALTRQGTEDSSEEFAQRWGRWMEERRDVAFVIGGAYGLDPRVLERCEFKLSLSKLTFPHELARLILLEQLYRALTILAGSPYHKAAGPTIAE